MCIDFIYSIWLRMWLFAAIVILPTIDNIISITSIIDTNDIVCIVCRLFIIRDISIVWLLLFSSILCDDMCWLFQVL